MMISHKKVPHFLYKGELPMNTPVSFDNLINTMIPLPLSGNANGEGIYCRGQELVASFDKNAAQALTNQKERELNLNGVFCQYCID